MKTQQLVSWQLVILALTPFSTASAEIAQLLPRKSSRGLANIRSEEILGTSDLDTRIIERDDCGAGYKACKNACIPTLGVCCENGKGYCDIMTVCLDTGCCPIGKICSDDPDGCLGSLVACGADKTCIPEGKICCEDTGTYCEQGQACMNNGKYGYCSNGSSSTLASASTSGAASSTRSTFSTFSTSAASGSTSAGSTTTGSTSSSEATTSSNESTQASTTSRTESSTSNTESASTSTGSAAAQTSQPGASSRMKLSGFALISCGLASVYYLF